MEIRVVRSKKRKKTVSARVEDGTMSVRAPAFISGKELRKIIENFRKRFERKELKKRLNREKPPEDVFNRLNRKYFDGKLRINSIQYVTSQRSLYGSCSLSSGNIRISHKVAEMPSWVRDYVFMHEMAHLIEPNHGRSFWSIVNRYSLTERARGFLIAKGIESAGEDDRNG